MSKFDPTPSTNIEVELPPLDASSPLSARCVCGRALGVHDEYDRCLPDSLRAPYASWNSPLRGPSKRREIRKRTREWARGQPRSLTERAEDARRAAARTFIIAVEPLPPAWRAAVVRITRSLDARAGRRGCVEKRGRVIQAVRSIVGRRDAAPSPVNKIDLESFTLAHQQASGIPNLSCDEYRHLPVRERVRIALAAPRRRAYEEKREAERRERRRKRAERLAALVVAEIRRRGGETSISGKYDTDTLSVRDARGNTVLLAAEGWRQYSHRFGARRASIAYVGGRDGHQVWAVRVPSTIRSVIEALEAIMPREAREAKLRRRKVLRQGDVYAVETRVDRALADAPSLPRSHLWDHGSRVLVHVSVADGVEQHAPMHVPFPCRLLTQRVMQMGRGVGRGRGD